MSGAGPAEQGLTEEGVARSMTAEIQKTARRIARPVKIMEVCGTHTVELRKQGVVSLLPPEVTLVSGPGCPVCVTPTGYIDNALSLVKSRRAVIASFGDMLRVPGINGETLISHAGEGGVKLVYSPQEVLSLAQGRTEPVVFLGVGFETTIPTVLAAFKAARAEGLKNLFLYSAFKVIPPALRALIFAPDRRVDGFLLPGHVSVIIGAGAYRFLEEPGGLPGVVTGFEGLDMLLGILMVLRQIERGENRVENAYPRAVSEGGNTRARALMEEMLEPRDTAWRGLGVIPSSGLGLRDAYAGLDAERIFSIPTPREHDHPRCLCRKVITGSAVPEQCPLFGKQCTPEDPVGPCMVSTEGTCAAHLRYGAGRLPQRPVAARAPGRSAPRGRKK